MGLKSRDAIITAVVTFFAWGYATNYVPTLRWVPYGFVAGVLVTLLALIALILWASAGANYEHRHVVRRQQGPLFLGASAWTAEVAGLRSRQRYKKQPLYAESVVISSALDDVLDLILRDFVKSWYGNISQNPTFLDEVDKVIRIALINLRDRLLALDLVEIVTTRFVPLLTAHFKDFYDAERAIRGKYLNRSVTESEELDLAIAGKYKEGKLHAAASLAYSDMKLLQQEYLQKLVGDILPDVLPGSVLQSRAVAVLIKEIVACAVLFPVMQMMSDPDTWNQVMEAVGRTMLQDRSTVRKLRAALDEHASPAPKSKRPLPFPRLAPGDNERKFEKFVRAIRKTNNVSDARRFRSEVASQLKRDSMEEGQDPVYIRRLEIGRKILDQRVNQLLAGAERNNPLPVPRRQDSSQLENASLVDLLHDAAGLSYFMEYMDRQHLMPLVQFWLVVDGFRNPLEEDYADDEVPASLPTWNDSDRTDIAQIFEAYLCKPEVKTPEKSKRAVQEFLKAGKDATSLQYFKARRATLQAQTAVLEEMQAKHFQNFKKSDLFYKCLASQEASNRASSPAPASLPTHIAPPALPPRVNSAQQLPTVVKPSPITRVSSPVLRKSDLRRSIASSNDIASSNGRTVHDLALPRRSLDDGPSSPLFDDDDFDNEVLGNSIHSLGHDSDSHDVTIPDTQVVKAMEAALNTIIEDKPNMEDLRSSLFGNDSPNTSLLSANDNISARSSVDVSRADLFGLGKEPEKPSIASLGLVNTSSRIGVFTDDDLFQDEERFMSDEYEDDDDKEKEVDQVVEAAPGDLGLAEAITALSADIDRLVAQDAVVDSLTRKAELTNNATELRILRKSKASLQREIRRKELQRQQYVVQESDNSLYGRATVKIKSIMVGREDDGREFAVYLIEVQRKAGEQMPAATWAITRRYSEFHELHQRLRAKYHSVKNLDFPRRRMVMKLANDFLQKRRVALERYVRELLLLPDVCRSRELRAFLSQSVIAPGDDKAPENKQDMMTRFYDSVTEGLEDLIGNIPILDQLSVTGQNLLSAATNQLASMPAPMPEDPVAAAEAEAELNAFEDRELEPFVKPICDIFLEVFELNRGNNWLRGRAVVVVLHQLLGGTIERKVRESVKGLVQEDAVVRYVNLLKDNMWPGGVKKPPTVRTPGEKSKSRTEASLMLATLIPDLAGSVVGRVNAQAASRRIFATFNNPRLNAHLAFTFLDEIIDVLFPGSSRALAV